MEFYIGAATELLRWWRIPLEKPLSPGERAKLAANEKVLSTRPKNIVERSDALWAIYDNKLFRGTRDEAGRLVHFNGYLRQRWRTNYAYVERLSALAEVVRQLPTDYGRLVVNESQARELAKIPAEQRTGILKTIIERGRPITVRAIRQAALKARLAGRRPGQTKTCRND